MGSTFDRDDLWERVNAEYSNQVGFTPNDREFLVNLWEVDEIDAKHFWMYCGEEE